MNADLFRATCEKYKSLRHIRTQEQLRQHTTLSNKTFLKNWHSPERFTLEQFEQIMNALNVPYEERWEILKK